MCYSDNKKICLNNGCQECKKASFESVENSKHLSPRNNVRPREITKGSNQILWFKCPKSDHEFQAMVKNVTQGSFCPYPCCANRILCKNECDICHNASFASSDKAHLWSDKNELSARDVFKGSTKEYWIKCPKSDHVYLIALNNLKKYDCPFACCKENPVRICEDGDCTICYPYSFESHPMSEFYSEKNVDEDGNYIDPRDLFLFSHKKYIFKCIKSKHEFEASLYNISANNSKCPYPCCCKSPNICKNKKCKICHNASFASHPKAKYLSPKNNIDPRTITKYSHNMCIFNCNKGHEFEMMVYHVSNNSWCSTCPFQNESYCIGVLEELTGVKFMKCRPKFLGSKLELDGYNDDLKLAIEYNGEQHYKYVSIYHDGKPDALEKQKERDKLKLKLCKENNVYLIVVPYYEKNKDKFIENEYENYLKFIGKNKGTIKNENQDEPTEKKIKKIVKEISDEPKEKKIKKIGKKNTDEPKEKSKEKPKKEPIEKKLKKIEKVKDKDKTQDKIKE
jgi:hypothetical protein